MPLPKNKTDALKNLLESYQKLNEEFENIPLKSSRIKGIQGNISACDLLAYQIGWGKLLLSWNEAEINGKNPEMPAKGYKWNQLGDLAKSFYEKYEKESVIKLRKELKSVIDKISKMIEEMNEDELFKIGQRKWAGEKWPVMKWVQVNTIAPYKAARTKVRRWKKENEL